MSSLRKQLISFLVLLVCNGFVLAQDSHKKTAIPHALAQPLSHSGSSPFGPPAKNDQTFVADTGSGLDTGCTFRSGGPLVITFNVTRVPGNITKQSDVLKLKANGLISPTARLEMPAYDVDYYANIPGINPERDRVTLNGHVVPSEFLTGLDNTWVMNRFDVPIEWVNFPTDPGEGNAVTPAANTIQIDIDTANSDEDWCTAIDWTSLTIQATRPVVLVHGILSSGSTWSSTWVANLNALGIANSNHLNMGNLDSIANNAAKISAEVESSKLRWGVDAVNLVTHSKGGLDSREYVENSKTVEKLVQLGTPNLGSPLADLAQGIAVLTLGLPSTILVNNLAGPAGVQLTRPYMYFYNRTHGSNINVDYTSLAGLYHPTLLGQPVDSLLQAIVGPGDTIVPVTSVYGLPYTNNLSPFESSGSDTQAKHTSLTSSQGVYNEASGTIKPFGTPVPQLRSAATSQRAAAKGKSSSVSPRAVPPLPMRTWSRANDIHQSEVRTGTIPVDTTSTVSFLMLYSSGNLDLTLSSPSGQLYTAASAGGAGVTHQKSSLPGGQSEVYTISSPEVGVWTYHVSGTSVTDPSGITAYSVDAWLDTSSIAFSGGFEKTSIHSGDSLHLRAALTSGGAALTGATATARVLLPNGTTSDISLHDDGLNGDTTKNDGIYSANAVQTQAGNYRVVFRASGSSPAFEREDFNIATVSSSKTSLSGSFTDAGIDSDGDGLFNQLAIDAGVSITKAAKYRVLGELTDSLGNSLESTIEASLSPSDSTVRLLFDGATIYQRGVNGPYTLSRITLAEVSGTAIMPVDEKLSAHQTAAYKATDFQHAALAVTGNGSAAGVDLNANGLFDQLVVSFEVVSTTGGFYSWSGRLTDKNGTGITLATNSGSLASGTNTIQLVFDGSAIGKHGVNGPYLLNDLLMYGSGASLSVPHVLTTGGFSASQFEGFTGKTTSITLTPVPSALTYGNALSVLVSLSGNPTPTGNVSYSLDGGGVQTAVLAAGKVTLPLGVPGAGGHSLTVNYDGDSTYVGTSQSLSFTVGKAPLKATADNLSRKYGSANPVLTYSLTGFVNGDAATVVGGAATLATSATSTSPVGTYPITFSSAALTAANYTVTYVPGTLTVTSLGTAATPAISLAAGTYPSPQSVTLTDSTAGAVIYFTTDGTTPSSGSKKYTGAITIATSETLKAIAVAPGYGNSAVASAAYVIGSAPVCTVIDYSKGFAGTGLTVNGSAKVAGGLLQLTADKQGQRGSAFFSGRVPTTSFTTDFTFQLTDAQADGFTFVIQGGQPTALGTGGQGLGYAGITNSVALKFDLHNNAGEGENSTGTYINGANPTVPSTSLTGSGVDLHSGHVFSLHLVYDGSDTILSLTDTVTKAVVTANSMGNVAAILGTDTAYFGFTGSTGRLAAQQNILTWSYRGGSGCPAK